MLIVAFAGLFAGCLATPYQPDGLGGGYSNSRVDASTMEVMFRANSATPSRLVESYLLYRCAQVTRNSGFEFFVPLNAEGNRTALGRWTPSLNPRFNDASAEPSSYFPPGAVSITDGVTKVSIRMFNEVGMASDPSAYRAADVIDALASVANGESETAANPGMSQPPQPVHVYSGPMVDYLAGD